MSAWLWLGLAAAGAVGAPLRYLVDRAVSDRASGPFPYGTLLVNVSGSFLLGLVTGLGLYHALPSTSRLLIGTGVLGAYTTFSAFAFETVVLARDGEGTAAVLNLAVSVVAGAAAAAAGLALASL